MAIDFGRMARGVATGYLGAKIANTEANDALNANIIERAGLNFYENTLPEWEASEKVRKETYSKVSSRYGKDVANYMDQNGFTDYTEIVEMLGANNKMNETRLKAYLEGTSAGTYAERAENRASKIQNKEKTIMGLTSGSSKIGNMTAELLLKDDETATDVGTGQTMATETITTPAVEGSQVGPVITEAVPEKTETREIPLPSFEEIFGDSDKTTSVYLNMKPENKKKYKDMALKIFKLDEDALTGDIAVAKGYIEDYKNGIKDGTISKKTTQNQYIFNRWFEEQYLPSEGITYQSPEPDAVTKARQAINYNLSIGNDAGASEARSILKSLGYDPKDYGL